MRLRHTRIAMLPTVLLLLAVATASVPPGFGQIIITNTNTNTLTTASAMAVPGQRFVYSAWQRRDPTSVRAETFCVAENRSWWVRASHDSVGDSYALQIVLKLGLVLRDLTDLRADWRLADGPDGVARLDRHSNSFDSANQRRLDYRFEVSWVVQGQRVATDWTRRAIEFGWHEGRAPDFDRPATVISMPREFVDLLTGGVAASGFTLGFYADEGRTRAVSLPLDTEGLATAIRETQGCSQTKELANAPVFVSD